MFSQKKLLSKATYCCLRPAHGKNKILPKNAPPFPCFNLNMRSTNLIENFIEIYTTIANVIVNANQLFDL